MPTNYSGRVALILVVVFGSLFLIVNPNRLFDPNATLGQKLQLKPGIDMVGGTSLLYEIKPPEGSVAPPDLAEKVMESLKKRVDPDGVRNLIWRPQGATRLEIQMPMTGNKGDSKGKREAFDAAQAKLDSTRVRQSQVLESVEKLTGEQRTTALAALAGDSSKRAQLFASLSATWDQIQQARQAKDSALQADKEDEYEKLKREIDQTNVSVDALTSTLDNADPKVREAGLKKIHDQFADSKSTTNAINQFIAAHDEFTRVKGSIDDAADLKRLLKGSGVLEFHILVEDATTPEAIALRERLAKNGPRVQSGDTMKWVLVDRAEEFGGMTASYNNKDYALVYITPDKSMVNGEGYTRWALEAAYPHADEYGKKLVGFRFDGSGASLFSDLTRKNVGKRLSILLDDKLISAPQIRSQIGRQGTIDGGDKGFSVAELNYLISTLNAGSLPAQLADEPISERTVGPQLGADNLRAGLQSCGVGLIVVAVFLFGYYYLSGIVAYIAVLINLIMILGVMVMLNATFTLPGVAGIVLTIGAAVDANVLIFERLREEQHRGLSLRMALRNAYQSASAAIIDSNATTVITSLILVVFGSEEVKGFGITLLIGLVSSLFTALFVTKTIFGIMIDKFGLSSLSSLPLTFPAYDRALKPNIDWMSKVWIFAGFSAVIMVVGCGAFIHYFNKGEMLDIEFASGTGVQLELRQPMKIEAVRDMVAKIDSKVLPSPSVVSVGTDERGYEIVTPNPNAAAVRDAIQKDFGPLLNVEPKARFDGVDEKLDAAIAAGRVVPLTAETTEIAGVAPRNLGQFRGGAAIVLKDLSPQLSTTDIRKRIGRQRLQAQVGDAASQRYREFAVESNSAADVPTSTAVVLVSDPEISFKEDEIKWRDEVAAPMWRLVNEAISKEVAFQKVNNFDAQVAGDTQRDALMAMLLSCVVIMAYIWLRFGNLWFGTATVLAMLHDTLLVVGAIGLSHLLSGTAVGEWLLLEPFRLNLTIVAAILTVMSYSMIDTIVVFDRIRENRGKYGHLDRKVINDSINQTLSRTLLTAGTTIVTVTVMYISGGPGIHGFTFVLLFGILVGTYSSIAIAAPILLVVRRTEQATGGKPVGQLQRA